MAEEAPARCGRGQPSAAQPEIATAHGGEAKGARDERETCGVDGRDGGADEVNEPGELGLVGCV
jgi:hypothetical protein